MSFLHNAGTVAKYEAVILRRSWFFRLFAIGSLCILIPMNIALFSPVGEQPWEFISIPSTLPLVNIFLLNVGQAIVVIFLASDFLKRDKKLDTNEVLYTRSVSNFEYITGKTWGILRLFTGLNLLILLIALIINLTQKNMRVDLLSYFEYILIITIPTIVFSLGLSFLLMSLIRNQAVTFMILLGIAALDMFWLWYRAGSIFDYMAFGLPVFKSDITGFDNPDMIISQRLFFFLLGVAFIMCTILVFKRLPQSKLHTSIAVILLVLSTAGSAYAGFHVYSLHNSRQLSKKDVIETNRRFENRQFPVVTDADIKLLHKGETIEAEARMIIRNDNPEILDSYLFSLNPSLKITGVSSGRKSLKYKCDNHIIEIEAPSPLAPGKSDTITIIYKGKINEAFISPDVSDNLKENINRNAMLTVSKREYFLNDKFILLTPETHWYPVASLNYYPSNPARIKIDFTRYTLTAKSEKGLTPVSQGERAIDKDEYRFLPDNPLTGLTIAMGNYMSDTIKSDSLLYITHYFPGNDYYKKDLALLKDTLPFLISGIMKDLETSFSSDYPFKKLIVAEVPVQFYSHPRKSTQTRSEVQPSLILVPEKLSMLENAGFERRFKNQKKRMERNNQVITDKELQVRLFNDFMRENFISGTSTVFTGDSRSETMYSEPSRYRLGPSFYFYRNNFYSSDYPAINAVFESHLQHLIQQGPRTGFMFMFGNLTEHDKANLILKGSSFREILSENPKGDTIRIVLGVKGDWLFNLLRVGAGKDEFNKWFRKYCISNEFRSIDIKNFRDELKQTSGFDFYPYLDKWYNGKEQPGFVCSDLRVEETVIDERSRYFVSFTVSNQSGTTGIFNVSFRGDAPSGQGRSGGFQPGTSGSGTGAMQGRGMDAADIEKIVLLEPQETKNISLITDIKPVVVVLNTLCSRNIPGEITMPVKNISKTARSNARNETDKNIPMQSDNGSNNEIIVDNEDPGFSSGAEITEAPLKRLLGITNRKSKIYQQISEWNIPEYWQPVVSTDYYGRYIKSAVYTRSGTGDSELTWKTELKTPGYYDIYFYTGKSYRRLSVRSDNRGTSTASTGIEGEREGESRFRNFHIRIYHDTGIEDLTFDYQNAEPEWNNLGRFYISGDSARVTLSNKSDGKLVIGDAVKWVRVE